MFYTQIRSSLLFNLAPMDQKPFHAVIDEHIKLFIDKYINGLENYGLYEAVISQVEKSLISAILLSTGNNQSKAAAILGISRVTLRNRIESLDIKLDV